MALLELAGVGKRYGRGRLERVALRDVSLELSAGELVAVWGRRNSGRSTLLRIAAGLEPPDEGVVSLRGRSLNARGGEQLREQIRYCRKTFRPTEGQLVIDRLITAQLTRGIQGPSARTRAHQALERVNAPECATLKPSELDIVETVLVGIARSLVHQPELLVIDEPTLGVDVFERDRILSLLRSLADEGVSVLMSVGETTCLAGADRGLSLASGELHGELQPPERSPPSSSCTTLQAGQRARERPSDPGREKIAAAMLELADVVKRYRGASEEVHAVDQLTLRVDPGEMVALHGPSGSGKTTLLLLIAALLQPDSGAVRYDGRDLASLSERQISEYQLRDIGFIYQRFRLMPRASALENAARKLLVGGMRMREAQARAKPWLERVGLGERIGHTPSEMSGGECQRVAIARVLACEPRLILADEPTGNLDSARGREIVQLLSSIAHERNAAVLLVTHDLAALEIADRSLALCDGKLTGTDPAHSGPAPQQAEADTLQDLPSAGR